jgi:lipid A 3-O-deacylase
MKVLPLLSLVACALAGRAGVFAAERGSPEPTARARSAPVFTVYFENDTVAGTDEHYTNGLKLSWLSADLVDWGQRGWRQTFVESLPFVNRTDGQKNIGIAFGQNIYTPRDIAARNPDRTDRPYAGWSYFEFDFVSKDAGRLR